jgi:hypothetical protein
MYKNCDQNMECNRWMWSIQERLIKRYTYTRDNTAPTFVLGTIGPIPCNPTQAQINAAVAPPTVSDNCSTGLTATYTDGCRDRCTWMYKNCDQNMECNRWMW